MATKTIYKVTGPEAAAFAVQDVSGVAQIRLDGTNVTSTAAELSILDGVTATAAEINEAADKSAAAVVALTDDASLTQAAHAGRIVTLGSADGDTVTLPAATGTGDVYTVIVSVAVTSNNHIIQVADATDVMYGGLVGMADGGDTTVGWETAADSDTITMDGSTKGGYSGDKIVLTDIAANKWQVEGLLKQTGTEATPFSAAVS